MLLRLQVTGFKNLLDVDLRFGAFTCVIGANGVGKSNVFDAIRVLRLLAEGKQFSQALQDLRPASGRSVPPESFFTHLGEWRAPRMTMAADMLTSSEVATQPRHRRDSFATNFSWVWKEVSCALSAKNSVR